MRTLSNRRIATTALDWVDVVCVRSSQNLHMLPFRTFRFR